LSISLPYRFILAAVAFVIIGMLIGLYMGPTQDHTLLPVHTHLNLLGWATMMLYGLYYRSDAASAARPIAGWHFWIAFIGMILFAVGLAALQLGYSGVEIVLTVGSILSLIAMLIFGWVVWQAAVRKG
jgi:hypothetical protein